MKTIKIAASFVSRYRHVIGLLVVAIWPLCVCWAVLKFGDLPAAYEADVRLFGNAFAVMQVVVVSLVYMFCGAPPVISETKLACTDTEATHV
jgi:hypothetical protein